MISIKNKVISNNQPNAGSFHPSQEALYPEISHGQGSQGFDEARQEDIIHIPVYTPDSTSHVSKEIDSRALFSFLDMKLQEPREQTTSYSPGTYTQGNEPASNPINDLTSTPGHHRTSIPINHPTSTPGHHRTSIPVNNLTSNPTPTYPYSEPSPSPSDHFSTMDSFPLHAAKSDTHPPNQRPSFSRDSAPSSTPHQGKENTRTKAVTQDIVFHSQHANQSVWKRGKKPKKSGWRIFADQQKRNQQEVTPWIAVDGPFIETGDQGNMGQGTPSAGHPGPGNHQPGNNDPFSQNTFEPPHKRVDDVTQYLMDQGFLHVEGEPLGDIIKEKKGYHYDLYNLLPEDLRENLSKMLDPVERKKMLGEVYKTRVFVASYWMLAIFFVLLFLPDSKFFAPFVAGYIGGRKAGSVWKGIMAALVPFVLLGLMDILIYYNIIYHFYDLYLPSAGLVTNNIAIQLMEFGLDPSGMEGSFYDPGTSLSKSCIYMVLSAIIGGTLEGDARKLYRDTAEWVNVSNISNQFSRKKIQ